MLKLPGNPFVRLELVHDPARPATDTGAVNHLVVPVEISIQHYQDGERADPDEWTVAVTGLPPAPSSVQPG